MTTLLGQFSTTCILCHRRICLEIMYIPFSWSLPAVPRRERCGALAWPVHGHPPGQAAGPDGKLRHLAQRRRCGRQRVRAGRPAGVGPPHHLTALSAGPHHRLRRRGSEGPGNIEYVRENMLLC